MFRYETSRFSILALCNVVSNLAGDGATMKLNYDPTLTLGNLIQIGVIVIGLVGGFTKIQASLERHDTQLASTARTVETLSRTQQDLLQNLNVLTAIVNERTRRYSDPKP